ncbi:MAG: hypothetical protein R3C11_21050 [Planctomycetaceae bacterium]
MTLDLDETIAALSSPPGAAARGVLRLSGPDVLKVLLSLLQFPEQNPQSIKTASRLACHVSLDEELLVPASLYYWPTSRSYTGQPAAEIQLPGSPHCWRLPWDGSIRQERVQLVRESSPCDHFWRVDLIWCRQKQYWE